MKIYILTAYKNNDYYDYEETYHRQDRQVILGVFATEEQAQRHKKTEESKKRSEQYYYNLDIYEAETNTFGEIY